MTDRLHILVPTDFSGCSRNAYRLALQLAAAYKGRITLLHAYSVPAVYSDIPVVEMASINEEQVREASELIGKWEQQRPIEVEGVDVDHKVICGFAIDEIKQAAADDVDLVVMGTKGADNIASKLIGTVSAGVINQVRVPTLIVPDEASEMVIDKMAIALQLHEEHEKSVRKFFNLADHIGAEIHCVHVNSASYASIDDEYDLEDLRLWINDRFDKRKDLVFDVVDDDDFVDGLNEYAERKGVDMIGMISYDKGFLQRLLEPSRTRRMALYSKVPLLVLHADN